MPDQSFNLSYLAKQSPSQQAAILAGLSDEDCRALLHDWRFLARPQQVAPEGDWQTWLILAGRGFGKTRTGAEWVREQVKAGASRIGLIAPTASDARDVMVEGESGVLSVCWAGDRTITGEMLGRPRYEPSKRRLTWANGAIATLFSAEEPERLRGPQHDALWCDELAAWKYLRETWDMAMFGLRLGDRPRTCITTTPKPLKLIREIMKDEKTLMTRGSTYDNAGNLAPNFLQTIRDKYEGTRLGRQELHAEFLEEAEGALWSRAQIDEIRHRGEVPEMLRVVVAIDPAVSETEESAETGIVVAGLGVDKRCYVFEDASKRRSPGAWAKKAVALYDQYKADRIVAEGNQGGNLVTHAIHTERANAPVKIVHARVGKRARAEPVAALYEQGKVSHVGDMPDLEDQMVIWEPLSGLASPDRLDALVWAVTELMLGRQENFSGIGAPVAIPINS
ncbi:DNA-packaging protein [Brucella endophytica]|uniref:DNA-packaging protein n=1 Tax=Brucella endophytica TaxID=1963359 RepID=A0A916SHJ7_9HYPH|nr:terminase family protein [Brucella endophytica]GGB00417.1 DNA-packaging protein [Brucella endophytica]